MSKYTYPLQCPLCPRVVPFGAVNGMCAKCASRCRDRNKRGLPLDQRPYAPSPLKLAELARMRLQYEYGQTTWAALARQLGCSRQAVHSRMQRHLKANRLQPLRYCRLLEAVVEGYADQWLTIHQISAVIKISESTIRAQLKERGVTLEDLRRVRCFHELRRIEERLGHFQNVTIMQTLYRTQEAYIRHHLGRWPQVKMAYAEWTVRNVPRALPGDTAGTASPPVAGSGNQDDGLPLDQPRNVGTAFSSDGRA